MTDLPLLSQSYYWLFSVDLFYLMYWKWQLITSQRMQCNLHSVLCFSFKCNAFLSAFLEMLPSASSVGSGMLFISKAHFFSFFFFFRFLLFSLHCWLLFAFPYSSKLDMVYPHSSPFSSGKVNRKRSTVPLWMLQNLPLFLITCLAQIPHFFLNKSL